MLIVEVALVMVMRIAEDDRSNSIWKQEKESFFRCALNPVGEYSGRIILGGKGRGHGRARTRTGASVSKKEM